MAKYFLQVFFGLKVCIPIVFGYPVRERAKVLVIERLAQIASRTLKDNMLVHRTVFEPYRLALEQSQQPSWIKATVTQKAAEEDMSILQEET